MQRSLLVLRALTDEDTGGISAAATTSLPETEGASATGTSLPPGFVDAALTISVLLTHGYHDEAEEWRGWLLRAIAGDPRDVQIMRTASAANAGCTSTRSSSSPATAVRSRFAGNAAFNQRQWDIFGEVMVALHGVVDRRDRRDGGILASSARF